MEPEVSLTCSQEPANFEVLCDISYGEKLLTPRPTPKLEDLSNAIWYNNYTRKEIHGK
jgi:hypothetical protein